MTNIKRKKIHFIGIGGTAMAALARAFSAVGFKVTGSDSNKIFPPMSDYLKKNKIKYHLGFNASNVEGADEVVIGNAHYSSQNPEVAYAREKKIELEHFPRLVEKYLIKKNSVVVAGTYGKTTITAMLAWLLDKASKNPNYMLGGIPLNWGHGARLTPPPPPLIKGGINEWSVAEGDEYPSASPWDFAPKFNYYHPKYLILTSAEWDHMDVYKTRQSYLDAFKNLVKKMPENGLIVAKLGGENLDEVLKGVKCKVIYYSLKHENTRLDSHSPRVEAGQARQVKTLKQKEVEKPVPSASSGQALSGAEGLEIRNQKSGRRIYFIDNIKIKNRITWFVLKKNSSFLDSRSFKSALIADLNGNDKTETIGKFGTKLLGDFNLENWAAALALACELKVPVKILQKAVREFKGVRRRLEIRVIKNGVTIIDDFAHNPAKARQSVLALKKYFPGQKIFIIFEPNRGGRSIKCLPGYENVFNGVDKVFIPKLTSYRPKPGVIDVSGSELARHLRKTHNNVSYEEDNEKILNWLNEHACPGAVIAFLGSRDFGGMIEKMVKKF